MSRHLAVRPGSLFGYNPHVRQLLLACLLAASTFGQTGKFGSFTNSDDVGDPPIKGAAEFDAATGQYKITGSGSDNFARKFVQKFVQSRSGLQTGPTGRRDS